MDIPIKESSIPSLNYPFKGNMDIEALQEHLNHYGPKKVGAVILTITNNSGGGQPVSMQNVREVSSICKKAGVLFILDCCRIAENAYFVKLREKDEAHKSYRQIASEMFELADGAVMSAKKDALVNMGGFLALRNEELAAECQNLLIITEGFTTYGGLSGRDMEAIAIGLREIFEPDYLEYRVRSTAFLGEKLSKLGVPIVLPVGGHAIYIDSKSFIPAHTTKPISWSGFGLRVIQIWWNQGC